jgi:hypothetical protein
MADNEIRVVITGVAADLRKALDGAKGDLGGLTMAIKEVPKQIKIDVQAQTVDAVARLRELKLRAGEVPDRITITADADTGVASARLRLLQAEAHKTETAIARSQLGMSSGGGGPGFGANVLQNLGSGGLPGAAPLAIGTVAAPVIAASLGSITALIGSASAALLGFGALGASVVGTLGVGFGGMLPVLMQAKAGVSEVSTAMDALTKAQADYGAGSKEAKQAQANLNGAIADAGPLAAGIAKQLDALSDQWQTASAPAQKALEQIIVPALNMVKALLPTVASIAKTSFEAIGKALDPVFKGLSSPAFKAVLTDLGNAFAKLAGPLIGAGSNLMRAFFSVAVAAAPYVLEIAQAFERWTASFAKSLAPGAQLEGLVAYLVGQLHSWWDLAKAIGDVMVTVFKSGAVQGQGMVDKLTGIVDKWNAWLNTKDGQAAMTRFFTESGRLLGQVLTTLAPIVKLIASMSVGLIPTMTQLLAPLAKLLASISQWINGLSKDLPPVLNALPGLAVAAGVLGSWAALKAMVGATATSILSIAKGGGAAGAAGAASGAAGTAERTAAGATSVEAAAGGAAAGGGASLLGVVAVPVAITAGLVALSKVIHGDGGINADLKEMRTQLKAAIDAGDVPKIRTLSDTIGGFGKKLSDIGAKGADQFRALADAGNQAADRITKSFGTLSTKLTGIGPLFKIMAGDAGQSLHTIQTQAASSASAIASTLGDKSNAARVAIATNFSIAAKDVRSSMQAGVINTGQGMKAISDMLGKALKALGGKPLAVSDFLADIGPGVVTAADLVSAGDLSQGGANSPHEQGGLIQIGRAGQRGRDTIPLNVGGANIRVGAGEKAAVFNAQQQAVADHYMAPVGGLAGMFRKFNRPHYMAVGGYVYPNGPGNVPERVDQGKDFGGAFDVGAIGNAIVERNTKWPGWPGVGGAVYRLTDGVRAGQRVFTMEGFVPSVSVGQHLSPGQVVGRAIAGPTGIEEGWANSAGSGPLTPYGGAADGTAMPGGLDYWGFINGLVHGKLTGGGGLGALGAGAPSFQKLANLSVKGGGAVTDVVRAALNKVTKVANDYGAAHGGGAGAFAGQGGSNAANRALGHKMMLAAGWPEAQWPALNALWNQESGWSSTAVNSGSGAYGIPQSLGHGHPFNLGDAPAQIAWGLNYIRSTYGSPDAAEAHERAFNWYEQGGFVGSPGFATGGAPGSLFSRAVTHRPATHPHAPAKVTHAATPKIHVPGAISDSLKRLLPADVVGLDASAAGYAAKQVSLSNADMQLTLTQGLAPYPAQPLVTISDADAAVIDPADTAKLQGLQTQLVNTTDPTAAAAIQAQIDTMTSSAMPEAGDELVNPSGMTVGRYFGPGGAIAGGSFVPGITQRQTQISHQLANLYGQRDAVTSAGTFYDRAAKRELDARRQRDRRRARVLAFLRLQVIKAKAIQAELAAITTGNLKKNVAKALSKQAIAKRLGDLRAHKTTVASELAAEKHSQAQLIPLEKDPTHTDALQAQLDQINQSIGVESQLSSSGAGTVAVKAARSALLKDTLTNRLKAYATVDTELGGKPYDVGTGGLIGQLQSQSDALDQNRNTDIANKVALAPSMTQIKNAIAAYLTERQGLGSMAAVQVRTPIAPTAAPTAAAAGPDLTALNALLATQLAASQQALALSQAQFGTLQGFAPLVSARLVGTFQSGIDYVPATGPALVHKGEMILPDPSGPAGNRAAASLHTAQGPISIVIEMGNNDVPLMKVIDARMNQKALQITTDHGGQRARLMAGVRRP